MGTFANYWGTIAIADEKKELFRTQLFKILDYGGMMQFESVSMFDQEIKLLKPLKPIPDRRVLFHFNYFEDDPWETAGYDDQVGKFWSNKVGNSEFCDVVLAAYTLYELYDDKPGMVLLNDEILDTSQVVGWINNLLGTEYTMEKRKDLWTLAEAYVTYNGEDDLRSLSYTNLMNLVPGNMIRYAGSLDLVDLLYITFGTDTLENDHLVDGRYPADILACKRSISTFLGVDKSRKDAIQDLVCQNALQREDMKGQELQDIAGWSLILPARVIIYLTSEICGDDFWKVWVLLRTRVYHDEVMKSYALEDLQEGREECWKKPVPGKRTSAFLRQDNWFTFYDTPEELMENPRYFISDDDRLYWWDDTDEVVISENMENWLKELAKRHSELEILERGKTEDEYGAYIKDFLSLLLEVDKKYKRIFPFSSMFYDFIRNGDKSEYRAAVELLRELADKYSKEGEAIHYLSHSWGITSRAVTFNSGRLKIKRYMALMANIRLRKRYLGF